MIKSYNSPTACVIANFARLTPGEQDLILTKKEAQSTLPYTSAMNKLYQLIRTENPAFQERLDIADLFRVFVFQPEQSSERLKSQSSAFIASAYHKRFGTDHVLNLSKQFPIYNQFTARVPHESKFRILNELQRFNITRETLFPGLDESSRAITDAYRQRIQEAQGTASDTE